MQFKIGDLINLEKYNIICVGNTNFDGTKIKRMAIVIDINKNYVTCKSLKFGYIESINIHGQV